jgi:MFS family permease
MFARALAYARQFDINLWVLSAGWFVSALGFALSIPFISIYFNAELGLSITEVGIFFGVMAVVRSIFQGIGGELSDRTDRRKILIQSQGIRSVALMMMAVSIAMNWGFWPVSIFLTINSIFGAIFQPVANAMVSDILPQSKRLDGFAITRSASNLGWAVGPAMGGFLAHQSYSTLFIIASIVTAVSSMVFQFFLKSTPYEKSSNKFRMSDLIAVKDDPNLATHLVLTFILFLVVAQLIAPFSVYAVQIVGLSEVQLGFLFGLNGLMVVVAQVPVTRLFSKTRLSTQLILGSLIYAVGYGIMGLVSTFSFFFLAIFIVTLGEITMSPPSLALASRMAPRGRMGRYMGLYGFVTAAGWSFGPLYGGVILDHLAHDNPVAAWITISSLGIVSAVGYMIFQRKLSDKLDCPNPSG